MANVISPVMRKLKRALRERFPPPATIRLQDEDGIIGVIRSSEFEPMDRLDRQRLIRQFLGAHLSPEEQRQVQIIIGVTPDEGAGYLPGPD